MDYGRKPYMAKNYKELLRKAPNKAMWNQEVSKHSEFEKPYKGGTYQEMQYDWPDLPGITGGEDWDFPWNTGDPVPVIVGKCSHVCDCVFWDRDICYCPGTSASTSFHCRPEHIIDYKFRFNFQNLKITELNNRYITIEAPADAKGHGTLILTIQEKDVPEDDPCYGFTCKVEITIWECEDCCTCDGVSIGYTTNSMEIGEDQTLTAAGGGEGCEWQWACDYGSITSAGVYTATETSPTCISTITLSLDGVLCDTLAMNVQDPDYTHPIFGTRAYYLPRVSLCAEPDCIMWYDVWSCTDTFLSGEGSGVFYSCGGDCEGQGTPCGCSEEYPNPWEGRSAAAKTSGCCPEALI